MYVCMIRLRHLARVPNHRIPKMCFNGWLSENCLQGGPRKHWKDILLKVKNLLVYISKLESLNARPVRDIFKAKEAIQYTNASICTGRHFVTLPLFPLKGTPPVVCPFRQ